MKRRETVQTYKKLFIVVGTAIITGCTTIPETTRTGEVRDVHIEANVAPEIIRARPGDEVRWVNHRLTPVKVILLDTKKDSVSCKRGFSDDGTAVVAAGQTASICLSKAGEVKYHVRMDSPLPGGEVNTQARIQVE
jgi:plastocyanin